MDASEANTWNVGQALAGRYEVRHCLRYSATVCLYRVWDRRRQESRLLLGPGLGMLPDAAAVRWFEGYCKAVLAIGPHLNVLTPERMDYEGKVPFLVMPDASGFFWDEAIQSGNLSELPTMLGVAVQVARGIAWLHDQGQIHYNVKPANVLISESWHCQVWKYGEAEAYTRAYASPEQLAHERPLTPATDVWSWAAGVLHMFVGKVTWDSGLKAPTIMLRYRRHGPAKGHLPRMPERLDRLLAQCFSTDPARRPADMNDVAAQVDALRQEAMLPEGARGVLDWVAFEAEATPQDTGEKPKDDDDLTWPDEEPPDEPRDDAPADANR